ncbi:MAG: hypothetical protein ACRCR9_04055 [Chitinophagaceae bacterium]
MGILFKFFCALCVIISPLFVLAQQDTAITNYNIQDSTKKISTTSSSETKDSSLKASLWPLWELQRRANDHIMIQVGYLMWLNKPANVIPTGMPNTVNIYAMYDFAFRSNPCFSVALGLGVTWNHMYFSPSSSIIDYNDPSQRSNPFSDVSKSNHFQKNRFMQFYLNVPAIEFRYVSNSKNTNKAFKASIGGCYGWMLFSQTIGKTLVDAQGNTINDIKQKFISNRFLSTGRVLLTARIGWGPVSAFVTYQPTSIFSSNGPNVQTFTVGLSLGGL